MAWPSHQNHERNSKVRSGNADLPSRVEKLEEGLESDRAMWKRRWFWMSVFVVALGIALVTISTIALMEGK